VNAPDGSGAPGAPTGPDDGYAALHASAGVRVVPRDVLAVSGPDAASYLQGQASQEIEGLAAGASADSLLLSPQGKVEALVRVTRTGDDTFVVDTEGGFGEVVDARLRRFRLRVKVEIEPLAWGCLSVRGPGSAGVVVGAPSLVVPVAWNGWSGVDLLGPPPEGGPLAWVDPSAARVGADAWEAARIEAGVPVVGRELTEGTIAAEVGLVDRTVSFTKGCFTGQELVARLDARGSKVARSLCGVVVTGVGSDGPVDRGSGGSGPPVGAEVWTADGEHRVGTLTSVAWSPGFGAVVALATLHRRVRPPEVVSVRWDDRNGAGTGVAGEARPLPLVA
jgi:folate-binding protein YgfZ